MMKFATATTLGIILLAAVVLDTSNASIPTVRGAIITSHNDDDDDTSVGVEDDNEKAWSTTHFGTTHIHRHLEPDNSDCLLVMRDTQFEDHLEREGESEVWVCEFPFAVSQSKLQGRTFIDIAVTDDDEHGSLTKATIDAMGVTSGESILKTTGAYIEEVLETGDMKMHIPNTATIEVISIDDEHESQHSRRLASSKPGTLSVLVIKVIDSRGAQLSATNAQLVNDIFEDQYCLKTGYASCSNNQLIIEPAANRNTLQGTVGVRNGITSITLNIAADVANDNNKELEKAAEAQVQREYGNVRLQYDLVMFCLPRTGKYVAYAYINRWLSVYNGSWCQRVSTQMHEVGHNLGFAHSNQNGIAYAGTYNILFIFDSEERFSASLLSCFSFCFFHDEFFSYMPLMFSFIPLFLSSDQSGIMGFSYPQDDTPKMCFNA